VPTTGVNTLSAEASKQYMEEKDMDGSRSSIPTEPLDATPVAHNIQSSAMISSVDSRGQQQASHSALMNIMTVNNDQVSPRIANHNKTSTHNLSSENHQGLSLIENLNNLDAKLDMNLNNVSPSQQDTSQMNFRSRNLQMHQSLDLK